MNAAATTQQLLDMFNIVGIIHFGIAGNANDSMSIGDVTIPAKFVNTGLWDWLVFIIIDQTLIFPSKFIQFLPY